MRIRPPRENPAIVPDEHNVRSLWEMVPAEGALFEAMSFGRIYCTCTWIAYWSTPAETPEMYSAQMRVLPGFLATQRSKECLWRAPRRPPNQTYRFIQKRRKQMSIDIIFTRAFGSDPARKGCKQTFLHSCWPLIRKSANSKSLNGWSMHVQHDREKLPTHWCKVSAHNDCIIPLAGDEVITHTLPKHNLPTPHHPVQNKMRSNYSPLLRTHASWPLYAENYIEMRCNIRAITSNVG